jgi:hypothetical protein
MWFNAPLIARTARTGRIMFVWFVPNDHVNSLERTV